MATSTIRFSLAATIVLACCISVQAQQGGVVAGGGTTGGATGGTGGGSTGGGTGGITGGGGATGGSSIGAPSATGAGGAMTADQAFSAVQRGATVGSTGATGSGFSSLSAASQGGGGAGGIGGLGGLRGIGGGGIGGLGGLSSLFGGLNTQGQTTKPAIRTRLRSAVLYEPHPPERVERRVVTQFRSMAQPQLRGVTVTMEGRRGVLNGVVESERHRRMSEMLLRLEPGVSEIDNRLEVASP